MNILRRKNDVVTVFYGNSKEISGKSYIERLKMFQRVLKIIHIFVSATVNCVTSKFL